MNCLKGKRTQEQRRMPVIGKTPLAGLYVHCSVCLWFQAKVEVLRGGFSPGQTFMRHKLMFNRMCFQIIFRKMLVILVNKNSEKKYRLFEFVE